ALTSRMDLSARWVRTQLPAVGPRPALRLGPSDDFPWPFERFAKDSLESQHYILYIIKYGDVIYVGLLVETDCGPLSCLAHHPRFRLADMSQLGSGSSTSLSCSLCLFRPARAVS